MPLDLIVIGKKTFNRNDVPNVVYVGHSRVEALEAVKKTAGQFPLLYYVSGEPYAPIVAPIATPIPVVETDTETFTAPINKKKTK